MPKPFKYFIVYNGGVDELELTTDPKGWQEHSIGFTRSEDFGNNVEIVVPLSFSGAGRTLLKSLYEATGRFTQASIRIEKRENDWSMTEFYVYRLDFKTYRDTLRFVEISGIEDGLLSKFQTYKDTEYEIALPATIDKQFISYTGTTQDKRNLIQAGYGASKESEHEDWYMLLGKRAVRTYDDKIGYTDTEGLPFETMTIRAITSTAFDFSMRVKLKMKVEIASFSAAFSPVSKPLWLIRHNKDFSGAVEADIIHIFNQSSTDLSYWGKRTDTFTDIDELINVTGFSDTSKPYISLIYPQDSETFAAPAKVTESYDSFFEITDTVNSEFQDAKIEVFTYEWLIEQLLTKIDSTSTFACGITYPNFKSVLSATPCIKNIGQSEGTGNLKVKLSDVLKSFNCLHKIGIDITGSTFTINPRNSFYLNQNAGLIVANNIVLSHDEKHQYSKITSGYDVDKRTEGADLVFPFNCKKEFEIIESSAENEIDLVNPFKGDCYDIDDFVLKTLDSSTNEDSCEFLIFALSNDYILESETTFDIISNQAHVSTGGVIPIISLDNGALPTSRILISLASLGDGCAASTTKLVSFTAPYNSLYRVSIVLQLEFANSSDRTSSVFFSNINTGDFISIISNSYTGSGVLSKFVFEGDIFISTGQTFSFAPTIQVFSDITWVQIVGLEYSGFAINRGYGIQLYRNVSITNFEGDVITAYNVPISPKRILQKHLDYLLISKYGSTDDIKFISTDFISAISSTCHGHETIAIAENADQDNKIQNVTQTPLFLPVLIECDTVQLLDTMAAFNLKKYKYLQVKDEKTGKIYEGWINSITFAPTKNKSQKLILQAKTI